MSSTFFLEAILLRTAGLAGKTLCFKLGSRMASSFGAVAGRFQADPEGRTGDFGEVSSRSFAQ